MLIQLFCVFPLVLYIFRIQILGVLRFGDSNPNPQPTPKSAIFAINAFACILFVLCTIYIPKISIVIRFAGAGCGMMLIFVGPVVCHLAYMYQTDSVKVGVVFVELAVAFLGVVNFILQFFAVEA